MYKQVQIFLILIVFCTKSFAGETFTLMNNKNGIQYLCSISGSSPYDEDCVPTISDYCNENTYNSKNWCFDTASQKCTGKSTLFKNCVVKTSDYCNDNTYKTREWCFEDALKTCAGAPSLDLLNAVKRSVLLKSNNIDINKLK